MDWKKIKHFKKEEFYCKHCNKEHMDEQFMLTLDDARDMAGVPFKITSGYRCPEHDAMVDGKGNHPTGKAADIEVASSRSRFLILQALFAANFRRIGLDETFIHVDDLTEVDEKPVDVFWLY
jgi:hypothetical protein